MSKSARSFFNELQSETLMGVVVQSERASRDSGAVANPVELVTLQADELERNYTGVFEFIREFADMLHEGGASNEFMAGYYAGAITVARAVTMAAENDELPELRLF